MESLDNLKRNIYLWIIPFIILALIIFSIVHPNPAASSQFNEMITPILFWIMLVSWYMIFQNFFFRAIEYMNLAIISLAHIASVYDSIYHFMAIGKPGALGIAVIWTPLVFILFFLTLQSKLGLIYSLIIFAVTLSFGMQNLNHIPAYYLVPLAQYYIANIVYIVILFFFQKVFKMHGEIELLKRNASVDTLTGIANRSQIDLWLDTHAEKATRQGTTFSIIFFDIDHFKMVNDEFGHKAGDNVLKEFAQLIKEFLPKTAFFGRWGGEEFLIIFNGPLENAAEWAEGVRKRISKHEFAVGSRQTASFGVTDFQPGETTDAMLGRADMGLYESKNQGRNQITLV